MFEDFSFTSPSSRPARLALDPDDRLMVDSDSNLISPLSSRCPSPQSHRFRNLSRTQQPPTSVPFPYDSDHKRLSISTLTQKLHEHTLTSPTSDIQNNHSRNGRQLASRRYPGYVLTPPDTDHSDDSGVGDGLSSPSSSTSPTFMPPDLLADLPDSGLGHPFHPQPHPYHQDVRMQRQQISRLQCNESEVEAMQRSLLDDPSSTPDFRDEDDCHPSSLPPRSSPRRRAVTLSRSRFGPESGGEGRSRRKSSSGAVLSSRIEKNHYGFGGKRNEQGLRRKSLVSAALASMVEKDDD
ncbi:unnamed protein product [Penicillium glandicola]